MIFNIDACEILRFSSEIKACISLWLHSINIITTENIKIVIIWWLDVQPPVQSVPITTNVVSSNLVHGEVY